MGLNQKKNQSENYVSDSDSLLSVNPFSNKEYQIPSVLDDRKNIDKFINDNEGKKVIVVQGLGYVGAAMAVVCANAIKEDYAVIGVDLANKQSFWKIKSINEGIFPFIADDPKIEDYFQSSRDRGNFYATFDEYAYSTADVVIVDINLDVQIDFLKDTFFKKRRKKEISSYHIDMTGFKSAIQSIGKNCRENALVLIESTVPPGTTEQIVLPILKDSLEKRGFNSSHIKLGHSSERVMPGPDYIDSIQNFYRVYSGIDEISADHTENFLRTIISTEDYPLTRLSSTNSTEISKVLENSYRAMNIAFISEWSRFAEESGVNLFEIIDAIKMRPTHSNMMYPGIGVGGYCLTKDPLLAGWSRNNIYGSDEKLSQSEISVDINNQMPQDAFNFLISKYPDEVLGRNILLLGVSYRGDVSDTRSSPVESFYHNCIDANCEVSLHDPYVNFWEEIKRDVPKHLGEVLRPGFDVVAITSGHSVYKTRKFIDHLMIVRPKIIYDSIGILAAEDIFRLQRVSKVCVIGRGDI